MWVCVTHQFSGHVDYSGLIVSGVQQRWGAADRGKAAPPIDEGQEPGLVRQRMALPSHSLAAHRPFLRPFSADLAPRRHPVSAR